MALRPLRNATITFGLVSIPVRFYTATKSEDVHFNTKKQNKVAVARWVSGGREHLVILRPFEEGLILHTMDSADEVRDFAAIEPAEAQVREKELQMAEMLIDELTEERFDPLQFRDDYRERLLEKIEAKSQGTTVISEAPEDDRSGEVVDIMEALRRSLERGRGAAAPRQGRLRKAPKAVRAGGKTRIPAPPRKRKAS